MAGDNIPASLNGACPISVWRRGIHGCHVSITTTKRAGRKTIRFENPRKKMNRSSLLKSSLLTVIGVLLASHAAQGSLIWTCGSSQSTFKGVEFQDNNNNYGSQNGSSLTRVSDGTEGTVWKFHKVSADRRCE